MVAVVVVGGVVVDMAQDVCNALRSSSASTSSAQLNSKING